MQLSDLLRSLGRRWYLVLILMVVTGGAAVATLQAVPIRYTMSADVVLIPPKSTEDPTANRYLGLGGLEQAVDVLVRSVDSAATRDAVEEIQPEATYEVEADASTSAPVLTVTAQAADVQETRTLMELLLSRVPARLEALQDRLDIRREFRITSLEIARDEEPLVSRKAQLRAVAAVVVGTLAIGLLVIALIDGLLTRRAASRAGGDREDKETAIKLAARNADTVTPRKRKPPSQPPGRRGANGSSATRASGTG